MLRAVLGTVGNFTKEAVLSCSSGSSKCSELSATFSPKIFIGTLRIVYQSSCRCCALSHVNIGFVVMNKTHISKSITYYCCRYQRGTKVACRIGVREAGTSTKLWFDEEDRKCLVTYDRFLQGMDNWQCTSCSVVLNHTACIKHYPVMQVQLLLAMGHMETMLSLASEAVQQFLELERLAL
jgi:hypothetical protein